jgi:hypothetical protein
MGVSRSVAELNLKIRNLPRDITDANGSGVNRIGELIAKQYVAKARSDNAGSLRFRNFGKRGITMGARHKVGGTPEKKTIEVRPTGRAAWRILEGGAKEHVITSRYAGGTRQSREDRVRAGRPLASRGGRGGRGVVGFGGVHRRWVKHPGVKAKKTWSSVSRNDVKNIAVREYREELRSKLSLRFR